MNPVETHSKKNSAKQGVSIHENYENFPTTEDRNFFSQTEFDNTNGTPSFDLGQLGALDQGFDSKESSNRVHFYKTPKPQGPQHQIIKQQNLMDMIKAKVNQRKMGPS